MIRANFISTRGTWHASPSDTIVLDHDGRHRRRIAMKGVRGTEFLLDLPDAVALRNGDALILEDGRLIEIVAAPEELAEVRCADARQLARTAYHLGNRHVHVEVLVNRLRIRRDHVLEDMVRGLGAKVAHIEAPFEPDSGAYETAEAPGHHHRHDHSRERNARKHDHGHDHQHGDHHDHEESHTHGHDGKHDHKHGKPREKSGHSRE